MPSIPITNSDLLEDRPTTKIEAPEEKPNSVFDYSLFETKLEKVLKRFFSAITPNTTQAEFWAIYQKEAEAFDKDYSKKYDQDLDTTLIFAGLFSAVTSAFILDIQGDLKPDYTENTAALILILIQQVKNVGAGTGFELTLPPAFTPDPAVVMVQAILYTSLASSLFAAFFAVLGKQWVNRYMNRKGGSQMERNHDRQEKLDGMTRWYFPIVMELLPLMLQAALLLFGCALTRYLWTFNHVVATVNLVFTTLGAFVYIIMLIVATLSYSCPYQTPFSIAALWILDFDRKHNKYIPRCMKSALSAWHWLKFGTMNIYRLVRSLPKTLFHAVATLPTSSLNAPQELHPSEARVVGKSAKAPLRTVEQRAEMKADEMNAASVWWILKNSTDQVVTQSALGFVVDIAWYPYIDTPPPPTQHAQNAVSECFDGTGRPIPGLRNKAYTSLKALGMCIIQENIRAVSNRLPAYNLEKIGPFRYRYDDPDGDLASLALLYNEGFADSWVFLYLNHFVRAGVSPSHLSWTTQFLVQYMLWQVAQSSHSGMDHIYHYFFRFAHTLLSHSPPLLGPALVDLIAAVGLTVGDPSRVEDLILDTRKNSKNLDEIISWTLDRLSKTSQAEIARISPFVKQSDAVERVVEVLEILVFNPHHPSKSPHWDSAVQSLRSLLSNVLRSSISNSDKWKVSSLVLKLEYKMDSEGNGWGIDDHHLDCVLQLLERQVHLPLDPSSEEYEETLLHILRASSTSAQATIVWDDQFINNLHFVFGAGRSPEVQKEAFTVIYAFSHQIPSLEDRELPAKICREVSFMLREFWSGLALESKSQCARGYSYVIYQMAGAPASHPFLFRDQWNAVDGMLATKSAAFLGYLAEAIGGSLPELIEAERGREATRVWLEFARRFFYLLEDGLFERIETAAAEVLETGEPEDSVDGDRPAASGDLDIIH